MTGNYIDPFRQSDAEFSADWRRLVLPLCTGSTIEQMREILDDRGNLVASAVADLENRGLIRARYDEKINDYRYAKK